ncbi:MAG TPA: hypothetical protein VKD22_10860 [Ramlibacter sp.]|nr:hypothetical protein [Ramlibacter sp.]
MGQSLSHAVAHAAPSPERPDLLELWRSADRVARQAEIRLAHARSGQLDTIDASLARAQALVLRQRANELLRAALGDTDGSVLEFEGKARPLRA